MSKTETGFKTEGEAQKAVSGCISALHATIDSIFAGVTEPGRANAALPLAGDPLVVLTGHFSTLNGILSNAQGWRIETTSLFYAFLRILYVQSDASGLRDGQKRALPALHAWAWNSLASLLGRLELTVDVSMVLKHFVTRVTMDSMLREALFVFLTALACQDAHQTVDGLARTLTDLAAEMLLHRLQDRPTSGMAGKRRVEETDRPKLEQASMPALRYLGRALRLASFQAAIPSTSRTSLAKALVGAVEDCPEALDALGALVLGGQPAYLSPDLPLFLRILSAALQADTMRPTALKLATEADYVIRPRRPLQIDTCKESVGRAADVPAAGQIEPATKQVEPVARQVEPTARQIEPVARQVEPIAKQVGHVEISTTMSVGASAKNVMHHEASVSTQIAHHAGDHESPEISAEAVPMTKVATFTPAASARTTPAKRPFEFTDQDDAPLPVLIDEGPDEQ